MTDKQLVGSGFILGVCMVLGLFFLYNEGIIQYNKEQINEDISLCIKYNPYDNFIMTFKEREKNIDTDISKLYNNYNYNCYVLDYIKDECINYKPQNQY